MAERLSLKCATRKQVSFHGVINVNFILLMCDDNIAINSKLQIYVVTWHHMCILHSGMYQTEEMISDIFTVLASENPSIRKSPIMTLDNIKRSIIIQCSK